VIVILYSVHVKIRFLFLQCGAEKVHKVDDDDDENGHADFAETVWGSWSHQIIPPFSKCNHELFVVAFSIF